MPQRILSLEIGGAELKAAVLQTSFRDYKVAGFFSEPLNGNADEQIKQFVAAHTEPGDTILSALPGDRVTWRTFFLPFRDQKKLSQTVPFELENSVPFGLDEVVVDYQVLHRDGAGSTVLAALVQRDDLEQHLKLLQASGADPKVVGIGPLAALNVLSLVPDRPPTFAFLDFGMHTVTVALYRERELVGLRALARQRPEAEGNGSSAGAGEDPIADVRWTLLALNGAGLDEDLPCYVAGDPALIDALERPLAAALGVEVRRLDRIGLHTLAPDVVKQAPAFSSSLGLALREVSPNAALGMNFRKGEFTFHRGQQELRRALRTVALLGVVVLVLTVLDMFVKYQQLRQQAAVLDTQIQKVFAATLPDLGRPPNPKGVLQQETDALRERVDLVTDIVPVSTSTSIDILRAAAGAVPNNIRIDCEEWTMDPDAVRVRCNTETYTTVDDIKAGLEHSGMFSGVEVKDAKPDPKGGIDFRMTMKLNKAVRPPSGTHR
ncbi:MAG TPA: type II secretion system protein GspL [Candidatus Dormibacteraeota bacterium]|nr:type II secretion system protein GspL [Candidatus Dormibacteraeota bacterium]